VVIVIVIIICYGSKVYFFQINAKNALRDVTSLHMQRVYAELVMLDQKIITGNPNIHHINAPLKIAITPLQLYIALFIKVTP
jgi:hypothetical protein